MQRRFDNGMNVGGYVYHVRHLTDDRGQNDAGQLLDKYRSELTGIGMEWGVPIQILGASLNVRLFTEPQRNNHMHGVRVFVSIAKKF